VEAPPRRTYTEFIGNQLGTTSEASVEACVSKCASSTSCVAWSFFMTAGTTADGTARPAGTCIQFMLFMQSVDNPAVISNIKSGMVTFLYPLVQHLRLSFVTVAKADFDSLLCSAYPVPGCNHTLTANLPHPERTSSRSRFFGMVIWSRKILNRTKFESKRTTFLIVAHQDVTCTGSEH
jgi:hypothetical protein